MTTAAGVWVSASVGLACGMGHFISAVIATVFTLIVLDIFSWIGRRVGAKDV